MCVPVAAVYAASAIIGAVGSIQAGKAKASSDRANASMYEQQARLREEKAIFDAAQADRKFRRQQGSVQAEIGTTGIDARSFYDVMTDDAQESALEIAAIKWSGQNEANNLQFQASNSRRSARDSETAGYIGAAGAVVGAASGAYGYRARGVRLSSSFSNTSEE